MINIFLDRESLNLEFVELEEKPRWASPWILQGWSPSTTRALVRHAELKAPTQTL